MPGRGQATTPVYNVAGLAGAWRRGTAGLQGGTMTVADAELLIRYEGPGADDSLLGATQANFFVQRVGHAAEEVAVLVNRPAAAHVAATFGQADTPETRAQIARVLGRLWITRRYARMGRLEPILMVSRATLDEDPGLVSALQEAVNAAS